MTVVDVRGRTSAGPGPQWVRDPLASDLDDRLVVRVPVQPVEPRTARTSWPVPRRSRRLPDGWPIAAAVAGWPLWWALGLTNLVFPVFAVPLAWQLMRRGHVRLPPGFWAWALFLVLVAASGLALDVEVTGAATSEGIGRYFAFCFRLLNYLAVTVMLLYVGNMSESELPRRRVIDWFSALAVSTIALGALSLLLPDFGFTTPVSQLLPGSLRGDGGGQVRLSQLQPVLGETSPRPSAPFPFTNAWGNNLSLLLVWLVVGWGILGSRSRRLALWCLLAVALVPIVFSLNRGMWIGLGLSVLVVAVRLGLRGRMRALGGLVVLLTVAAFAFAASPLETMVEERLAAGHSNEVRGSLAGASIDAATQSPVLGFGSTRNTVGSDASIAIGPSESCPRCGARTIGSTGQLTLLLISQGFLGALLYCWFLARTVWRYARDHSALGLAGTLVVGLELFYALFYSALTMPLAVAFLSIGLLWRNDRLRADALRAGPGPT